MFTGNLSTSGRSMMRPRLPFKPTSPQQAAGMRIDPPPSFACAIGTTPAATRAADPPEDPPTLRVTSHGLRVGPDNRDSVVEVNPNSGSVDLPKAVVPSCSNCVAHTDVERAGRSVVARDPSRVGSPVTASLSLMNVGIPPNAAAELSGVGAGSVAHDTTALSRPSTASARRRLASTNSTAETSRRRSRSSSATTSSSPSASSVNALTRPRPDDVVIVTSSPAPRCADLAAALPVQRDQLIDHAGVGVLVEVHDLDVRGFALVRPGPHVAGDLVVHQRGQGTQ